MSLTVAFHQLRRNLITFGIKFVSVTISNNDKRTQKDHIDNNNNRTLVVWKREPKEREIARKFKELPLLARQPTTKTTEAEKKFKFLKFWRNEIICLKENHFIFCFV